MIKYNSVDKIYKLRQLFPTDSEKVVSINLKQEKKEKTLEGQTPQEKAA
jgi:hypothetical protein